MRLNRLILNDFGLYRSRHELDLSPRWKYGRVRPVVLVGGHNGAGKTTILEAIRLCLYGRLALGERISEQAYHQYLRERVHRNRSALIQSTAASVALEFEYSRAGKKSKYFVERSWDVSKSRLIEELAVLENGEPLTDVDRQFWSEFLRSLVPPGLSQLFFFDGEKIQKLAEDTEDAATLAESVKALLGLDLVERLQADLDLFVAKEAKDAASGDISERLQHLERDIKELTAQISALQVKEAGPRTHLESVQVRIRNLEQLLAVEGHAPSQLKQEASEVESELASCARALREICEGPLPLAFCPSMTRSLLRDVRKEAAFEQWTASKVEVEKALTVVTARLTRGTVPKKLSLNRESKAALAAELSRITADAVQLPPALKGFVPLHGLSPRDRDVVRSAADGAIRDLSTATKLAKRFVLRDARRRKIQEQLAKTPDGTDMRPRVNELADLHKEETDLQVALAELRTKRERLEEERTALDRERRKLQKTLAADGDPRKLGSMAARVRESLTDYLEKLTEVKVRQLESATMDCFRRLCRKNDLVRSIHIDEKTFQVELADATGHRIPKTELSAGEKQIYAISVLWGLAKVSGRPLPMIIDTPLGRLDSIHRQKLVESYFPAASHQVIVLSTDTEVDASFYDALRPHLSHSIKLVNADGCTEPRPGYFWVDGEKEERREAASG